MKDDDDGLTDQLGGLRYVSPYIGLDVYPQTSFVIVYYAVFISKGRNLTLLT